MSSRPALKMVAQIRAELPLLANVSGLIMVLALTLVSQ
jgi:hypothetical protein